jgi:hypothetical protein
MAGAVHVPAGNTPPSVSITNPANGMVFSEPATILLQVTASDPGGSVTNVQFVQATTILTNQTVSPYFTLVSNLVAGIYTFSAIASDNKGATATNTISVSVVAPVEIILSSPQSVFGTNFQFDYSANAGLKYVVERSANLTAWNVLSTNVAVSNTVTFVHTNTPVSPGFYRVGRLPNP